MRVVSDIEKTIGATTDFSPFYKDSITRSEHEQLVKEELNRSLPYRSCLVVDEVYRILKQERVFIVSNSQEREPIDTFKKFLERFRKVEVVIGRERYLLIATK